MFGIAGIVIIMMFVFLSRLMLMVGDAYPFVERHTSPHPDPPHHTPLPLHGARARLLQELCHTPARSGIIPPAPRPSPYTLNQTPCVSHTTHYIKARPSYNTEDIKQTLYITTPIVSWTAYTLHLWGANGYTSRTLLMFLSRLELLALALKLKASSPSTSRTSSRRWVPL